MNKNDENLVRILNLSVLTPNAYSVKIHCHISDFDTQIPYTYIYLGDGNLHRHITLGVM